MVFLSGFMSMLRGWGLAAAAESLLARENIVTVLSL